LVTLLILSARGAVGATAGAVNKNGINKRTSERSTFLLSEGGFDPSVESGNSMGLSRHLKIRVLYSKFGEDIVYSGRDLLEQGVSEEILHKAMKCSSGVDELSESSFDNSGSFQMADGLEILEGFTS
jgi:hypothetical protein